jgi:hypothetical protein
VSLIGDAALGLQMESSYPIEVYRLRQRGVHLAEVSCFATRSTGLLPSESFDTFVNVVAFTIQLARHRRVEQLLIAVHPDHEPFYRRLLGFRRFGGERSYPAVRGNLAVACMHDFAKLDRDRYPLYDLVYEVPYPMDEPIPLSAREREYFRHMLERESTRIAA